MKILRLYYTDTEEDIESIPCSRISSLLYTANLRCLSFSDEDCGGILELTAKKGEEEILKKLEKDLVKFLADENTNKNIFNLSITLDEDEYVKELSWEIVSTL